MKKLTLLATALMVAFGVNAQPYTVNNPIGEDGMYIVKWDCETGQFAASNNMEADETFVFAIDVTGHWLENWLKEPATAAGASRGVACNFWTGFGDVQGDVKRFVHIKDNVYGITVNLYQVMTSEEKVGAIVAGEPLSVDGMLFGFEYTADNPGAGWWMWGGNPEGNTLAEGSEHFFACAPYTGTKISEEFFADDFVEPIFGYGNEFAGYAAPCATPISDGIENIDAAEVVSVTYFDVLGNQLQEAPITGLYIKSSLLTNGQTVREKVWLQK